MIILIETSIPDLDLNTIIYFVITEYAVLQLRTYALLRVSDHS